MVIGVNNGYRRLCLFDSGGPEQEGCYRIAAIVHAVNRLHLEVGEPCSLEEPVEKSLVVSSFYDQ